MNILGPNAGRFVIVLGTALALGYAASKADILFLAGFLAGGMLTHIAFRCRYGHWYGEEDDR
jgi:hypothetical protein